MWANYSIDQKKFTGYVFNIKLEEKSYKMSFKALPVKIKQSKNQQGGKLIQLLPVTIESESFSFDLLLISPSLIIEQESYSSMLT